MLAVLSVTLPIFLLIALGFASTRLGALTPADIRSLGAFVLRFALPALIFKSLTEHPIALAADPKFLIVYGAGSLIAFALIYALARAAHPADRAANAMQALGASASNSGFIGFPIATLLVGPQAALALALCMVIENIVMTPLALSLAEGSEAGGGRGLFALQLANRLARNPLLIAIALGLAFSLAGLHLPAPLEKPIDMLALASAATALFSVGGALVGVEANGMAGDVARVVAGKLLLHPLAVFAAFLFAPGLDPAIAKSMLIMASAPVFGVYPLLCRPYGQERTGAAVLLVATSLSFVTISLLLAAI